MLSSVYETLQRKFFRKALPKSLFRRAAHYFGDHSPIGFWIDQDFSRTPDQLRRLRADGFDTVILVLNWPLFQTNIADESLDPWYAKRLKALLIEIHRAKLHAMFRVGFMHQPHWGGANAFDRPMSLYYGNATRDGFARMIRELVAVADSVNGVDGMFFSWEDMWCAMEMMPHQPLDVRQRLARESDFHNFLHAKKTLEEINNAFDETFGAIDEVPIPAWGTKAMSLFVAFFDNVMRETIVAGRAHYPTLMPELRVDAVPIARADGGYDWLHHDHLQDLPQRATYWGPFYGARNVGESISAQEAIKSMEYLLAVADPEAKGDLFVEQFNFFENNLLLAPMHARLGADQWESFFHQSAQLLAKSFSGYGIWTTRDYRENWFANATFQRGLEHWQTDNCVLQKTGLQIAVGGRVVQHIRPGSKAQTVASAYKQFTVELCLATSSSNAPRVEVMINNQLVALRWDARNRALQGEFDVSRFEWDGHNPVEIRNVDDTAIVFNCMYLYGFVQRLGTYDEYGSEGRFVRHVRNMNAELAAMKAGDQL
ncbi:MAG: hypothetical protein ACRCWJ_04575 [Casimicrobium sp.]